MQNITIMKSYIVWLSNFVITDDFLNYRLG